MTGTKAPPEMPLLAARDLEVTYRAGSRAIPAVRGVTFDIADGETVALVGESGSGKSSVGLAFMGLLDPAEGAETSGSVMLTRKDGTAVDVLRSSEAVLRSLRGSEVAMIFQEPMSSLNPVFTIGSQIAESIACHGVVPRREIRRESAELLREMGIPDPVGCLDRYPHQLSGGMRQRIMIAMALSGRPRLLIADEPTTALDVTIQAQIIDLLRRVQDKTGMSILFVTHNLGLVASLARRCIVMYAGQIVEALPVERMFEGALMPYTQALVRSIPRLGAGDGTRRRLETISGTAPLPADLPAGCAFHPRCPVFIPGRCDELAIPLQEVESDHFVRCIRTRGLEPEARS
jgi:oligopeptide/dipeptide ABC transporter ATP-binding protein